MPVWPGACVPGVQNTFGVTVSCTREKMNAPTTPAQFNMGDLAPTKACCSWGLRNELCVLTSTTVPDKGVSGKDLEVTQRV